MGYFVWSTPVGFSLTFSVPVLIQASAAIHNAENVIPLFLHRHNKLKHDTITCFIYKKKLYHKILISLAV